MVIQQDKFSPETKQSEFQKEIDRRAFLEGYEELCQRYGLRFKPVNNFQFIGGKSPDAVLQIMPPNIIIEEIDGWKPQEREKPDGKIRDIKK